MKSKADDINVQRLYEPFEHVQTRPIFGRGQNGERRKVAEVSYITARQVMDRLDEVFGVFGWSARFFIIADNTVCCELSVELADGKVVTKSDIGYSNNNNDSDNGYKGAASDALKRAAVHFGIGRYLYGEGDEQGAAGDNGMRRQGGSGQQAYVVPRLPRSQAGRPAPVNQQNTGRPSHYERQGPPFGSDEQGHDRQSPVARINMLRAQYKWTDAQFRDAFGVNYSNEVVEQMIADGMTPEEINETVMSGG